MVQYVVPEVKELYNWLEVDFHPLKLCGRVCKVNGEHLGKGGLPFHLHIVLFEIVWWNFLCCFIIFFSEVVLKKRLRPVCECVGFP